MGEHSGGMVVVGGGECGAYTAFALRDEGWSGPITVVGHEALHAYERPPLSKTMLVAESGDPVHPFSRQRFQDASIELRTGVAVTGVFTDEHAVALEDGSRLGYDKLLLAVGAQPRQLSLPPEAGLLYLRTHEDAVRIKSILAPGRRIGILGAGFIGLELAASARSLGCVVTVIEFADRALARAVPAAVAELVIDRQVAAGVRFLWSMTVQSVRPSEGGFVAGISSGESLRFDAVIVGIGAAPDVQLAERAGLDVDNGIAVDDRLRTSATDVFAAGDCASFPHPLFGGVRIRLEAWRNAQDQAATVAKNMFGRDIAHTAVPWFWSDQFDHSLQVVGLASQSSSYVVRHRPDGVNVHFGLGRDGQLTSASAFGPGNSVAKDIRLAELMIERSVGVTEADLADPSVPLKKMLSASTV
jgi:3-phenylpropionate/trans-cinnamate dioxygenase ferredoxin reductase component